MRKCSRCGSEILTGQVVCPDCGKPQPTPRQVRCRYCGGVANQRFSVCPDCGEPLRRDWRRPLLWGALVAAGALLAFFVFTLGGHEWPTLRPVALVGTVQALASDVPVLVEVPSLTPSLTPSVTPTPTRTPIPTLTPSVTPTPSLTPTPTLTPMPTETPSPTPTDTPSPTATRSRPSATPTRPTATPMPQPTVAPPVLTGPEDGGVFRGGTAAIGLTWQSSHTLQADEYYLVSLRYTHEGAEARVPVYVQAAEWFVDDALYLEADQETERLYRWTVRIVRRQSGTGSGAEYAPISPVSEERSFYWR